MNKMVCMCIYDYTYIYIYIYIYRIYTRRRMVFKNFPFIDGIQTCGYWVSICCTMIGSLDI